MIKIWVKIYNNPHFYKEWQRMLGLRLVLVILHKPSTISTGKEHKIGDTKYTIQCSFLKFMRILKI